MEEKRSTPSMESPPITIVAIGASAGGIEAVTELFENLSPNTGLSYIYIQHLDPTHESMLVPILGRKTRMAVVEARDNIKIEPNTVYVIPPNQVMTITDGTIKLEQRKAKPALNMPIDHFFTSLAEIYRESSIGIILSGNAHDGTQGLKAIRHAGGITMVQDDSAKFVSMPKSAIAEEVVDMVLSPAEIAKELERISQQSIKFGSSFPGNEESITDENEDLKELIRILRKSTGVDFTHYKMNTIKRRIIRRLLLHKLDSLEKYVEYIRENPSETKQLYNDLLINVTSFFRDPDAIEYLKKSLLPTIIKSKSVGESIRIWIPACSTGEEAYSIAMILMELLGEKAAMTPVQIFGTDLSNVSISKARLGLYPKEALLQVSPKRIQRFFTKVDGSYRVVKSIRDMVIFAPHNVFKDPPFSRLDLISCCNLLIYLDTILQKKVIATFHYSLLNNGFLMLGRSETIGSLAHLFSQIEKKYKIYAKRKEASERAVLDMNYHIPDPNRKKQNGFPQSVTDPATHFDLEKTVDELLLSLYVRPCVVVNQDLEILHFKGSTGLYLEPSPGKASLNLLKMAKPGLGFELRNAIHKAGKSGDIIKKSGIEIKDKTRTHFVSIEVMTIQTDREDKMFLITFDELPVRDPISSRPDLSKDELVIKLQDELQNVRDDMRSIIEEQEASNEELQSANEEIVSSNEELQSINEELETSKEEVESTNEELMTINTELQVRNEQLAESYEYAEAVFGTIREAVLVLDKELIIRSANKSFYRIFKLKENETEGIRIFELSHKQWDIPQLRELLEDIIAVDSHYNGFEFTHTFSGIGEKTFIVNVRKLIRKIHSQQVILLAMEDITEHRQAEKIIRERETWFRDTANNAPSMIWVIDRDKKASFCNRAYIDFTGHIKSQDIGDGWLQTVSILDKDRLLHSLNEARDDRKNFQGEFRIRRKDGEYRWVLMHGKPNFHTDGYFTGIIISGTEIHDQVMMNEELEKRVLQRTKDLENLNSSLARSNNELKQFAYVASHDLQEPLRKILSFADRLQKNEENKPDLTNKYIEKISSSASRMSNLIDDLLNFSSISNADKKFTKTDLNTIIESVLPDFEANQNKEGAQVTYSKLPTIAAIPLQMKQLFHNLISNGLKFSKKGEAPIIKITAQKLSSDSIEEHHLIPNMDYVEIVFKDNGIGIKPQYAEQIFEIFQRLNNKDDYPGTGIGLALCYKIVINHKGLIFVKSEEGQGSEFHVILPVKQ